MNATRPERHILLRLEALEDRLVLSAVQVSDSTQYPFSAIVRIEAHFPDQPQNEFFEGTGTLIDSFHVLTAGHVLFDTAEGGWADQVRVFPGQNGPTNLPFGVAFGTVERTFSTFANLDQDHIYTEHGDLGLLTLDREIGTTTGTLALGYNSDPSFYTNLAVNTAGYPAEQGFSGYDMFRQYGPIIGTSSDGALVNWNYSSLTTIAGQSGSPLWEYVPSTGQRIVFAVLVSGDDNSHIGFGVRLTQSIVADLTNWEAMDPPPAPGADGSLQPPATGIFIDPSTAGSPGSGQTTGNVTFPTTTIPTGTGIGAVDPTTATWYLNNMAGAGSASAGSFQYGVAGWSPVVGDWNGDGVTTIGMFDPSTATWYLRNENSAGSPDAGVFQFGEPGWIPVVGDWTGTGTTGIGVFDPTTATFYLRNEASAGIPDAGVFQYGMPGWKPVTGSWDGGTATHIGVFDPTTAKWYLRNENSAGSPDAGSFQYGVPGWTPVTGSWLGGKVSTVGVVDTTTGTWYLHSANTAGIPDAGVFQYGVPGWEPVAGHWQGIPEPTAAVSPPVPLASAAGQEPDPGQGSQPATALGSTATGTLLSDEVVNALLLGQQGKKNQDATTSPSGV
jgi:V8-like Glu-specific endopeptidase